jgi:hypothetical protein
MKRLPAVHAACVLVALAGAVSAQDWCFAPSVGQAGPAPVITLLEDLDGDGNLDLVTSNHLGGGVSVFLGQGDRTFGPRSDYPTSALPWDLDTGDFDEDGLLDLVVGHDSGSVISLLFGLGGGAFAPAVNIPVGSDPASVEVGLIDGDAHLDLAVKTAWPSTAILLGAGDGSFTAAPTITDSGIGIGINLSLVLADVNGDGILDYATMGAQSSGFLVRLGVGDGTFGPQASFGVPVVQSVYLTVADLNGDGNPDLVSREFTGLIAIGYGVGDGTFVTATVAPASAGLQPAGNLAVTDLDLDGDLDIAIGGGAVASKIVALYANNGNGTFAAPVLQELPVALKGSTSTDGVYGTTAGDLDGDGRPELVVSHRGSSPPGVNLSILGNRTLDACALWTDLGGSSNGGEPGNPWLVGTGPLTAGSDYAVSLFRGEPASTSFLVYGVATLQVPFKGGTLVPDPLAIDPLAVAADGTVALAGTWPGVISGLDFYLQHWVQDADAPTGFAASNGLQGTTP